MGKVWKVNKKGMEKAGGWSEPMGERAEGWMRKLLWSHDDFDSQYHSVPSQTPDTKQHVKTDFLIKVANLPKQTLRQQWHYENLESIWVVSDLSNVRTIAVKLKSYPSHQTIHEREPKMSLKTKGLTEHPFRQQLDNIHQEEIQYWEELFIRLLERPKKNGSAKNMATQEVCGWLSKSQWYENYREVYG